MEHVREKLSVSERRACRVLGQARSTQRRSAQVPDDEARLVARVTELASEYGRYGYRRITALLQREGWRVNHKRVERIWCQEGLKVPKRQPKRGRLWLNDGSCLRKRPSYRNHVWSYDFLAARTHDGRPLRMLAVMDEFTRECLALDVERKLNSEDVLARLTELFVRRGLPAYIRSDNGAEFTANAVRGWLTRLEVRTLYIERGSPWENGYVESFIGKRRDELLNGEIFYTLTEAKVLVERWRQLYNRVRPHSALGYRPPAPEAIEPLPLGNPEISDIEEKRLTQKVVQLWGAGQGPVTVRRWPPGLRPSSTRVTETPRRAASRVADIPASPTPMTVSSASWYSFSQVSVSRGRPWPAPFFGWTTPRSAIRRRIFS